MSAAVLFDGVCNLCNASVAFILRRDRKAYFRFASLQSEAAKGLLQGHSLEAGLDSIVLLEDGKCFTKSTAALRIARHLGGLWPLLYAFLILPRWIRDPIYDWVARNRYRWFGHRESCMLPSAQWKDRFLESPLAGGENPPNPQN
ncbi:MAG: thiol-disulfide oxidoreductase DCC family protein [Deltaproteobacteria bacterium]|nr:thiol-disulfide oxidoreductase DCC family protein [Deltaproteobacteria bacterium]